MQDVLQYMRLTEKRDFAADFSPVSDGPERSGMYGRARLHDWREPEYDRATGIKHIPACGVFRKHPQCLPTFYIPKEF